MSTKLGNCGLCEKELRNTEDFMQNPDGGSLVTFKPFNEMRIIGNYGSTVFDQCIGFFTDYEIFSKFKTKFEKTHEIILYICDECLSKLIEENKIFYIENARTPLDFTLESIMLNFPSDENITSKDVYIPIKFHCLALKFNDGTERLCNIANNYMEFKEKYKAYYDTWSNKILIFQGNDDVFELIESVCENEVLILYENGTKFEIMSEELFKQRFTFFV